ncbi:hypothetical protein BGZ99_002510 [Dissophora globulifera]|uniref:DDHD domain-containing protein n=1 Tax=Dissophora globulifera TaxID=979702 RepID=A0A9P6RPI0_9FUNG|nr:hypothetical protein BGZ99_002510 [Dissophora globulifera]
MSQMPATVAAVDVASSQDTSRAKAPVTLSIPPLSASSPKPKDSVSNSASSSTKKPLENVDQYPHHVIFIVHGMGRQLEEFGNYERNVGYLVDNIKAVLQSQFHDLETDVHIIPIEWHAKLHGMVDQRMALTSLRTVPKVRLVMNDYFADILYYFNNHFGAEIIQIIVEELNEAYSTFMAKHPDFNGKIAVYALSLGGVAIFDILTCMDDDEPEEENGKEVRKEDRDQAMNKQGFVSESSTSNASSGSVPEATSSEIPTPAKKDRVRKQDQPKFRVAVPKLKFRPDILFTIGSPVGAVMVMRNLDWETFHPPDDILHHNIFHPFDPLAYRIEPLIDPTFSAIPAVTLISRGSSQLFPISLPSLLPSIPGSISSFWENKVPALPRPSIPKLSTLSQMTQSLKAGRWLPGSGDKASDNNAEDDGNDDNENISDAASGGRDNEPASLLETGESQQRSGEESPVDSEHDAQRLDNLDADGNENQQTSISGVSITEAIAAATVATYLDQKEGGRVYARPAGINTKSAISTMTLSPSNTPISTMRRPNLGPRRVSSRMEEEVEDDGKPVVAMKDTFLDSDIQTGKDDDDDELSSTTQAADLEIESEDTAPLHMEYYMGMEQGPSTAERMQGEGAKSNVVQEEMVCSLLSSPILESHAHHAQGRQTFTIDGVESGIDDMQAAHEEQERARQDLGGSTDGKSKTVKKVTIIDGDDTQEEQRSDSGGQPDHIDAARRPLRVGGRETKVPYRIDHVLQETRVDQYTNEYLLGMRSHFRYWGNRDIAFHILKTMLKPGNASDYSALDLQPEMPSPKTASKNAKVEAEAKAKAAGAAYRQEQDAGRRKSFGFAFSQTLRGQPQQQQDGSDRRKPSGSHRSSTVDSGDGHHHSSSRGSSYYGFGSGAADYEEEQLFGYRYSDLDMSSAANVPFNASTLYQNSPFANNDYSTSSYPVPWGSLAMAQQANRRRSSGDNGISSRTHAEAGRSPGHNQKHGEGIATDKDHGVDSLASSSGADNEAGDSPPSAFDEGIVVPDLARPAKLHHRSLRVD